MGLCLMTCLVLYLPSYFNRDQHTGGRLWPYLFDSWLWDLATNYQQLKVVRETRLDPTKQYIFAFCPHGLLALSRLATYGRNWNKIFPGIETRVLGASPMFNLPMCREIVMWLGAIDAGKASANYALAQAKVSLIVFPGGTKELMATNPKSKRTRLVLRQRKGFVKLAIAHGVNVVPVFVFGEKWLYSAWRPPKTASSWMIRSLQLPMVWPLGRWGTFLPYQKPLGVVYGQPIEVRQEDEPSQEQIDSVHAEFIARTHALFTTYKAEFGYDADEELVVE